MPDNKNNSDKNPVTAEEMQKIMQLKKELGDQQFEKIISDYDRFVKHHMNAKKNPGNKEALAEVLSDIDAMKMQPRR